jgi:hypothetical protein
MYDDDESDDVESLLSSFTDDNAGPLHVAKLPITSDRLDDRQFSTSRVNNILGKR